MIKLYKFKPKNLQPNCEEVVFVVKSLKNIRHQEQIK